MARAAYTPVEVVTYMVAALDRALRDDLGTAGLTDAAVTLPAKAEI